MCQLVLSEDVSVAESSSTLLAVKGFDFEVRFEMNFDVVFLSKICIHRNHTEEGIEMLVKMR